VSPLLASSFWTFFSSVPTFWITSRSSCGVASLSVPAFGLVGEVGSCLGVDVASVAFTPDRPAFALPLLGKAGVILGTLAASARFVFEAPELASWKSGPRTLPVVAIWWRLL
jgi:hypothetical protein